MELKLKPKLNKLSAELRFKPKLASWENTLFIAQMFEGEFPDWQIDQGVRSHIVLFSREEKEFLKVGYNSLVYVVEGKDNVSRFLKFIKMISEKFEENKIEVFQQLGYRNISFFETDINYPELCEIIFEKFFQAKNQTIRKPKGSGLGLAISKKIIQLHEGKIGVTANIPTGARFTFTLPINKNSSTYE